MMDIAPSKLHKHPCVRSEPTNASLLADCGHSQTMPMYARLRCAAILRNPVDTRAAYADSEDEVFLLLLPAKQSNQNWTVTAVIIVRLGPLLLLLLLLLVVRR